MQAYRVISITRYAWDIHAHAGKVDSTSQATSLEGMGMELRQETRFGPIPVFQGNSRRSESRHDWPGKGFGIRGPILGETPLSESEVLMAVQEGWL